MAKTLLQEAIAEAKQVREAAIKNATKQLEENLTPSIKAALAQKLEENVNLDENEEESLAESIMSDFKEVKPKASKQVKEAADEDEKDNAEEGSEEEGGEEKDSEKDSEESSEEGSEESNEKPEGEESEEADKDSEKEDEVDDDKKISDLTVGELTDLIQGIIASAAVPAPEGNEGVDLEPGDVEGAGEEAPAGDLESTAGEEATTTDTVPGAEAEEEPGSDDEEIDLNEILKELEEEGSELSESDTNGTLGDPKPQADQKPGNTQSRQKQCTKELAEAYRTIRSLKRTLSEVNLLNSKLVYTTRMLRRDLTESQKAEVISAFDEAKSPAEVKVVYRTLSESVRPSKRRPITEGRERSFASRSVGRSTAAQGVVESNDMVRRMQQLAGIID